MRDLTSDKYVKISVQYPFEILYIPLGIHFYHSLTTLLGFPFFFLHILLFFSCDFGVVKLSDLFFVS